MSSSVAKRRKGKTVCGQYADGRTKLLHFTFCFCSLSLALRFSHEWPEFPTDHHARPPPLAFASSPLSAPLTLIYLPPQSVRRRAESPSVCVRASDHFCLTADEWTDAGWSSTHTRTHTRSQRGVRKEKEGERREEKGEESPPSSDHQWTDV